MRAWKWAVAVVFVAGLAGLVGRASAQEPRYAAVDANNEGSLQVVWDASKDGASEKAVSACNRVSKSCSGTASYTNEPKDVFAYMCCTRPQLGCSIGVGEDRTAALAMVRKTFSDAGFSQCTVKQYLSAESGKRLN